MIPSRLDAESCDNWFLRIMLGLDERLTALETAAKPKDPAFGEGAAQALWRDTETSPPDSVTGYSLDLDAPRYQAAFVECAECHAKPGTPALCPSCLANRDKIHMLRRALETANGIARQWKLNYDAVKAQFDKVPHPAYKVAAEWKDKHDQQKERAAGLEKELGTVREQLREKTDLLHKSTADYRAQYKRAEANQAAADTLDKLRRGEAVGQDRLLHFSLPGELAKLRAERAALAAQLADVDAARVAAEDLANANAADVGILERRLAELDRTRPQYPPHTPGMTCTINGEPCIWTAVDTINSLRRDAERWRTWAEMLGADFLKHAWTGKVDAAIAVEAAKGEVK